MVTIPHYLFQTDMITGLMVQLLEHPEESNLFYAEWAGGQHDLLDLFQHSWSTNVCPLILSRCYEQEN